MNSEDYEKSSLLEHYAQSSLFILYGQYGLVDVGWVHLKLHLVTNLFELPILLPSVSS
jgi:hypothetical protein